MRAATATFFTVFLFASTAWAQPAQSEAGGDDADEAAFKGSKKGSTVYDFEDDNVDGEILSPDGANIASRGRTKHASLITIRPHFILELIKMANDV